MLAQRCPTCGERAADDMGPDTDGEYTQAEYDDGDVPHVLVCLNDHEWLDGAE
jgi:hypothetical protein